jgi:hypothetical protein
MYRSRHHQAGLDVDTLALSQPTFDSFFQQLQQDCMLLDESSYLSYTATMNVVIARGPLRVQTLLPQAPCGRPPPGN